MKRFFIIAALFATTFTGFSQSLGYQDLGVLFSQNDQNGTARFTAMGGAFGALGGDVSSININPAGLSVFNGSMFSGTFNSRSSEIMTNYYGQNNLTENNFSNISQAGAVLVFDAAYASDWSKFGFGFNYRITKDFNDSFLARGNSNVATFIDFPLDINTPPFEYNIADEQRFKNDYTGDISEINMGFSSVYQNKLHVGIGLNFYDLTFSQVSNLTEFNSDINGNELDANLYQENYISGSAFSLNSGIIYRVNTQFRFGLAYQTPTWFSEILEENNILDNEGYFGDTEIAVSNDNVIFDNTVDGLPSRSFLFQLKTPSKVTASAAFIFGSNGLLSVDYSNKNYKNMKLSGDDFSVENQSFKTDFRNTHNVNIGTEWRVDNFSVRGGYRFEQSPYKVAPTSDNLSGYSLGGGYDFGNFRVDLSYSNSNKTSDYNFYSGFNVNPAELTLDNKVFTATVSLLL